MFKIWRHLLALSIWCYLYQPRIAGTGIHCRALGTTGTALSRWQGSTAEGGHQTALVQWWMMMMMMMDVSRCIQLVVDDLSRWMITMMIMIYNDGVIFNTSAHVLRFVSVEVTGFSSCSSTRGWRCGKGQETGQRCERLLEQNRGIIARPSHSI